MYAHPFPSQSAIIRLCKISRDDEDVCSHVTFQVKGEEKKIEMYTFAGTHTICLNYNNLPNRRYFKHVVMHSKKVLVNKIETKEYYVLFCIIIYFIYVEKENESEQKNEKVKRVILYIHIFYMSKMLNCPFYPLFSSL